MNKKKKSAYTNDRWFLTFDSLYLFTSSQIHQIKFATELLLCLSVFLFDVYQENTVTPGAVLIHV